MLTALEICAGAGGQALGLEQAGFSHAAVVEVDADACATLRLNRDNDATPEEHRWPVIEKDVRELDGAQFVGVDLLAGGVPCPPFSIAGKQLGQDDERDLFPTALNLVHQIKPKAVLLENVRGLAGKNFTDYRNQIVERLEDLDYAVTWNLIYASQHGVPQLRPRFVLVGISSQYADHFRWPDEIPDPPSVGSVLYDQMAARGWPGAQAWAERANDIGPTLVGGSKKHGGPDLGPSRARAAWAALGVNGGSVANEAPGPDFPIAEPPKLTLPMTAAIQGFPPEWKFSGRKTAAYRQVGNAFPPPVARALGTSIAAALNRATPSNATTSSIDLTELALIPE